MYRAKSARSGYSDESRDHENDSLEIELQKLQQRYRIAEGERKALISNREQQKRNQKEVMKLLDKERNNLNKDYYIATSKMNETRDGEYTDLIRRGVLKIEQLKREMENEKQIQSQMDSEIRKGDKKTKNIRIKSAQLRDKEGAGDAATSKKLNDLEGRLYRANSRFNQKLTENQALRNEIETLRIKYKNFQIKDKKYEKILMAKKEEINEVIEASQEAHEQREEAKNKAIMVRTRAEKDLQQYDTDIKDEERKSEYGFHLKEFMEVKNLEREERNGGVSKKVSTKRREQEQLVQTCESSWERIQEIAGDHDLDSMLEKFVEVERENFALFNFINEMNNQIEMQSEDIENLQKRYDRYQAHINMGEDEQRSALGVAEKKISSEVEAKEAQFKELEKSNEQFEQITDGLKQMMKQIDVEYEIKNNSDLIDSLGAIEDRINELIAAKALIQEELEPDNVAAIKHILVPEPPALALTDEDILLTGAPSTRCLDTKKFNRYKQDESLNRGQSQIYDIDIPETQAIPQDDGLPLSLEEMRIRSRTKSNLREESMRETPNSRHSTIRQHTASRHARQSTMAMKPHKELDEA